MIINVATKNPAKIQAVMETIQEYDFLRGSLVIPFEVSSGVSEQPKSLEETITGAINRAESAFNGCNYSIGIESGLMKVPGSITGSLDFCACVIYDGTRNHMGFSSAFEFPLAVTKMIHERGMDSNQAFRELGLTTNKRLGYAEGAISILTNGRLTRKDYTKQALQMALISLENPDLY